MISVTPAHIRSIAASVVAFASLHFAAVSAAPLTGVVSTRLGDYHTCAWTTAGALKCWGLNTAGQLGDGTLASRSLPNDVLGLSTGVAAGAAGAAHSCALTTGGAVKCWGNNFAGQVGDGSFANRTAPVDVVGLAGGVMGISAGGSHSCAVSTVGGVKCWGYNSFGEVGDGTAMNAPVPVDVVGLSSGVAAVEAGESHSCALLANGFAKCWGYNAEGRLGNGTNTSSPTPVDVVGLSGAIAISAGGQHTCALTSTGGVKCWGDNTYGQVGDGTNLNRVSPVNVTGLASGVAAVSAGTFHTCALMTSGGIKCWGYNASGQLGDGTTTTRFTPVDVTGLGSGMAGIGTGAHHSCAVTSGGGGMYCWGANLAGQLGNASSGNYFYTATLVGDFAPQPRLTALSTRMKVLTGDDVLIGGFAIGDVTAKTVVIRARGPSLGSGGVANTLANPTLQLFSSAGLVAANDDWQTGPSAATIQSLGYAPAHSLESAILASLGPGGYTAIVSGSGVGTGVGIVEIFEVDRPENPLIAISTRGQVLTGDDVMIAGFVIQGTAPQTVVVRGRGPSLSPAVASVLANPHLTLVRSDNAVITVNDDWATASNAAELSASGFAPANALESAILITLPPGAYTAILRGANGETGVGLVEVFAR